MNSNELRARLTHIQDQMEGARAEIKRIQTVMDQERTRLEDGTKTYQNLIEGLAPYAEDDVLKQSQITDYENQISILQSNFDRSQSKEVADLQQAQSNLQQLEKDLATTSDELKAAETRERSMVAASLVSRANDPSQGSVAGA